MTRLEALDRALQARPPHPLVGTGSLHASIIEGGHELSSYPDRATLQMERRTLPGEPESTALRRGARRSCDACAREDATFRATARRDVQPARVRSAGRHTNCRRLLAAPLTHGRHAAAIVGASFWTDAAVLGHAGIPSVLFGPGGAGLHSTEEYVNVADVMVCRDALVELAGRFCCRDDGSALGSVAFTHRRRGEPGALCYDWRPVAYDYAIRRALTRCGRISGRRASPRTVTVGGASFNSQPGVSCPHETQRRDIRSCSKCSSVSWP